LQKKEFFAVFSPERLLKQIAGDYHSCSNNYAQKSHVNFRFPIIKVTESTSEKSSN